MKTRSNVRKLSQDEIGVFLSSQKIGTLSMNDGENHMQYPWPISMMVNISI